MKSTCFTGGSSGRPGGEVRVGLLRHRGGALREVDRRADRDSGQNLKGKGGGMKFCDLCAHVRCKSAIRGKSILWASCFKVAKGKKTALKKFAADFRRMRRKWEKEAREAKKVERQMKGIKAKRGKRMGKLTVTIGGDASGIERQMKGARR